MLGFIYAAVAGAAMSIQGVMNSRLSEKTGLFEANMFVQLTAFILSLIVMLIWGNGSIKALTEAKPLYWFGGLAGILITVTVMLSIKALSPAVAISAILVSQLAVAAAIDAFGIMDTPRSEFTVTKAAGLVLMLIGVWLIKKN